MVKNYFCNLPFLEKIRAKHKAKGEARELQNWLETGKPSPPPHIVKQNNLRSYAEKYRLRILVETGTFYGDMVAAMKDVFEEIYSIELSEPLFRAAQERFRFQKNITLIQGDSGHELQKLVPRLKEPALFWLDGHYSGGETALGEKETPILKELSTILRARDLQHIIIIDDARLFGGDPAYPKLEELIDFIREERDDLEIETEDDGIRIVPYN